MLVSQLSSTQRTSIGIKYPARWDATDRPKKEESARGTRLCKRLAAMRVAPTWHAIMAGFVGRYGTRAKSYGFFAKAVASTKG